MDQDELHRLIESATRVEDQKPALKAVAHQN